MKRQYQEPICRTVIMEMETRIQAASVFSSDAIDSLQLIDDSIMWGSIL